MEVLEGQVDTVFRIGAKVTDGALGIWRQAFDINRGPRRNHNLILGHPQKGDTVLMNYYHDVGAYPLQYRDEVITYTAGQNGESPKTVINSVSILDCWDDGTGGSGEILDGGIGQRHVKIKFTSAFSRGYAVRVIVTGQVR